MCCLYENNLLLTFFRFVQRGKVWTKELEFLLFKLISTLSFETFCAKRVNIRRVAPIYDNESQDLSPRSRNDEILKEHECKIRIGVCPWESDKDPANAAG